MNFDLSDIIKATESPKSRLGFNSSALFSIPDITERSKRILSRNIDTTPFKILDAPGLVDDYYLNLLDWTQNRISLALGDTVYCYNVLTKDVSELFKCENAYISSIKGLSDKLLIGDSNGKLNFYDFNKNIIYDSRKIHNTRICSIAVNQKTIATGEKSGKISSIDVRSNCITNLLGHTQEVCGLKWSPNNEYLASGSNDNTVRIWKTGSPISKQLKGHESAVKGIDWCPWRQNILATGGGSKDKTIKVWDTQNSKILKSVEVNSQVCTLTYINKYKELISSHGFQDNDLRIWKGNSIEPMKIFGSHDSRVLHTALSPDECTIVSLGADESLKFWRIAEKNKKETKRDSIGFR